MTHSNAEVLRELMDLYGLTRPMVASMCGVGKTTVDSWLGPPGADWRRDMPDRHLMVLRLHLGHKDEPEGEG